MNNFQQADCAILAAILYLKKITGMTIPEIATSIVDQNVGDEFIQLLTSNEENPHVRFYTCCFIQRMTKDLLLQTSGKDEQED